MESLGNKVAPCFPKASGLLICESSRLHVQSAPFGLQKVDDIPHKFPEVWWLDLSMSSGIRIAGVIFNHVPEEF